MPKQEDSGLGSDPGDDLLDVPPDHTIFGKPNRQHTSCGTTTEVTL
jgi:hypothetical protein